MRPNYSQKLFCPGPVNVSEMVKRAAVSYDIGHRESEFSQLFVSVKKKLFALFEISTPRDYSALLITGSGTAANEAVLSSVVGGKRILVVSNGEFGERLFEISAIHNKHTYRLDFGWARPISLKRLESYILENKIDILSVVHHETSTGMLNPVEKIGRICKRLNVIFIVDAVSSAGCERVRAQDWNISFLTTSVGKAISSMPGIGVVVGKKEEFEKLKELSPRSSYLNLYKYYYYSKYFTQTPNTPAVNLVFALNDALSSIVALGIKNKAIQVKKLAVFARREMKKMGLKFLIDEKLMCNMLTTVVSPFDVSLIQGKLKERGYVIYKGKGQLEEKVFQVANIGEITIPEMKAFLVTLKDVLDELTGNANVDRDLNVSGIGELTLPIKKSFLRTIFKN